MFIIFLILLILLAAIIVSGIYVFFAGCVRGKELPWLNSEAMKGTPYEKYDNLIHYSHQWLQDHHAQDLYIYSEDGLKLHGLWVQAENAKGTVILAHGYKSTMLVDFGMVLDLYHKMGLNLLLPEQRAHGKSKGKIITFGVKESGDMLRWLSYHNKHFGYLPVVLSGLSMGASTMMYLVDQALPENVKGFIVDCGFSSPAEILSHVFTKVAHLPAVPVIWITELCARIAGRFSLYARNSCKTLAANHLPIIMVHGKADTFVPCQMTQKAYEACTGEKKLLLVENAGHGVSFLHAREEYCGLVNEFMTKYVFSGGDRDESNSS